MNFYFFSMPLSVALEFRSVQFRPDKRFSHDICKSLVVLILAIYVLIFLMRNINTSISTTYAQVFRNYVTHEMYEKQRDFGKVTKC